MSDEEDDDKVRAMVRRAQSAKKVAAEAVESKAGESEAADSEAVKAGPPVVESEAPEAGDEGDDDEAGDEVDDVDLKEALRGALRPPPGAVVPQLLQGVQKRLRVRSKGKFYGDGWSTAESPRSTYLITSILMLVIMVLVFLSLVPWEQAKLP